MRVLVTGGAGFIGANLVELLVGEGHDVVVLDDLSTGTVANLEGTAARVVVGSILDHDVVESLVGAADLVFHLAAVVGVRNVLASPLRGLRVNVRGTEEVLEACTRHGVRVVLASTSEVYGRPAKLPMSEDDDRVLGSTAVTRWSYATAKALDEHFALALHKEHGLAVSTVRYFNAFGPRMAENGYGSVVASFLRQALTGAPLTVHGDGQQTRCFTYVGDSIRGTYLAGTVEAAIGTVLNLGARAEISIIDLAQKVLRLTQSTAGVTFVPAETAYGANFEDARRRVPDVARARDVLGWQAQTELDEGLERTLAWWQSRHDAMRAR